MEFKTELHCHTAEVSPCSNESGKEVAEKYIAAGYTTLVIANHAAWDVFYECIEAEGWEAKIEHYYDSIELVRNAAAGRLHVIDGMEIRFNENGNDYLVFGMTKEFMLSHPDVFAMTHGEFHKIARDNGMLLIQAHPLRSWCQLSDPEDVDGYEVFNGHIAHSSHNSKIEKWVRGLQNESIIMTSGTDSHRAIHVPNAGITTDFEITNTEELISVLKSGNYTLIKTDLGQED